MAGVLMDRYGRKVALATPLIPMILAWILTATATSCTTLFTARVLLGIFGGFGPPICQVRNKSSFMLKIEQEPIEYYVFSFLLV